MHTFRYDDDPADPDPSRDLSDEECLDLAAQLWGPDGVEQTRQMLREVGVDAVCEIYSGNDAGLSAREYAAQRRAIVYLGETLDA